MKPERVEVGQVWAYGQRKGTAMVISIGKDDYVKFDKPLASLDWWKCDTLLSDQWGFVYIAGNKEEKVRKLLNKLK